MSSISSPQSRPLLCSYGNGPTKCYPIPPDRALRVGRADDNDVVVNCDTVSRYHCELTIDRGEVVVRDLGSHNGTRVDNKGRVSEARLGHWGSLCLGNSLEAIFVVSLKSAPESVPIDPNHTGDTLTLPPIGERAVEYDKETAKLARDLVRDLLSGAE